MYHRQNSLNGSLPNCWFVNRKESDQYELQDQMNDLESSLQLGCLVELDKKEVPNSVSDYGVDVSL